VLLSGIQLKIAYLRIEGRRQPTFTKDVEEEEALLRMTQSFGVNLNFISSSDTKHMQLINLNGHLDNSNNSMAHLYSLVNSKGASR